MPEVDTGRVRAAVAQVANLRIGEQLGPHAGVLGALAWEEEGDFRHRLVFPPHPSAPFRAARTSPPSGEARGGELHLFFGFDHLAAGVVAAVRADGVWAHELLAVRARLKLHVHQREMRTPATLLRLGELDLRQSHGCRILPKILTWTPLRRPRPTPADSTAAPRHRAAQSPACARGAPRAASTAPSRTPRPAGRSRRTSPARP